MNDIKVIAFDVDGTLTVGNIWKRAHAVAGISDELDQKLFTAYYNRTLSFTDWAEQIVALYKKSGKTRDDFATALYDVEFIKGAQNIVRELRLRYEVCLVSSGIDLYVGRVANMLGINTWHANYTLMFDANDVIANISYMAPEEEEKVLYLKQMCAEKHLNPSHIVFVGDSSNDLPAFEFTGRGILVGPGNDKLKKAAWKQVDTISDILEII